jgi:predicted KAP-like P-loop ATPase
MDGDRPVTNAADDRLGFASVAEHLATAILDQSAKDGFVVGIEGKWGSGKSTLINLTIEALLTHGTTSPVVVRFSPWLVGDRDTLLRQLFDELAAAALLIDPIAPAETDAPRGALGQIRAKLSSAHWRLKQKERAKKEVARKLRGFGLAAGAANRVLKTASAFGVPGTGAAASAVQETREALSTVLAGGVLSRRKAEIVDALKVLSRVIVVFIDDLDRLEPRDASEVLRLVRAVADFPNVIYVVSYDPDIVANTLSSALQVNDGKAFLEKIVQVSFKVPLPEAFDLRNWFRTEVNRMFAEPPSSEVDGDPSAARLIAVVNTQGGQYLRTPRDVVRGLNALRLHATPVRGLIDVSDMVWLQLVRIGNPDLYEWVESYLTEVTAMINRAHVTDAEAKHMSDRLDEILKEEGGDAERKVIELARILPGIDGGAQFGNQRDRRKVLNGSQLTDHLVAPLIANKRLGSPQHYRYYFSFSEPAGALRDEMVSLFIVASADEPDKALATFKVLASQPRPQGGLMADVLIDRLTAIVDRIPPAAVLGIVGCFTETLDDIAGSSPDRDFGADRTWNLAERLTSLCLKKAPSDVRAQTLEALFTEGRSIGWLTNIIRDEIFAHGTFGDRKAPEDEWLLTSEEFDAALNAMLLRYRSAEPGQLMRTPNFLSLLYGWQQGSGTDEVQNWVDAQTATDAGLLALLPRMRSMAYRDAVVYPLNKTDIERFFDYERLTERVQSLIDDPKTPEEDRMKASEVMAALRLGERSHR